MFSRSTLRASNRPWPLPLRFYLLIFNFLDIDDKHDPSVEIVKSHKDLATTFEDKVKFDVNIDAIVMQGQQRIHLLCKLDCFSVSPVILCHF